MNGDPVEKFKSHYDTRVKDTAPADHKAVSNLADTNSGVSDQQLRR